MLSLFGYALAAILIIIPLYILYKPPRFVIRFAQRKWEDVLWNVATSKRIVALTIDDGPSEYTSEILDILRSNDATATFFVIGSHATPDREEILRNLIRHGNELANHAMRDEPSYLLSETELIDNINCVQKIISDIEATARPGANDVGLDSKMAQSALYFRPGGGFFSTKMREILSKMGYHLTLGDIYPHDPFVPFWKINNWHILSSIHPGGIIICHDGRSWTPPMLRKLLPELKRRGFQVVTLTALLKEGKCT
ncbi:TPA_exp: putative Polysaccharide deacetylase (NodB) [Trichophyton benhamiae CBS 112371]|uniref:chitin deacetylase n=1 Tax=Arthroderma benhamiae (strain ATCC MYA-4681 / CBS 112371) TaxID=663331 RepID=D4B3A2_ARTBC|nr:polysaccharide deacetylase (NodB), putative [Trichophyton benhamiae CBS 112371]EFE30148.1 polysaccharide deacetylase (NodB), putative [Trichophyton benhamiae CBS 112371]DAA73380.1 TPA_exp: putative Polysaccharide deacetylase (NodB) [Trichophyton benhamiae CBS 112371]